MLEQTTKPRLHLHSIVEELPDTYDNEIGELFREMRQATSLSQQQTARQFNTSIQTIGFLEQGHLSALPPWNETHRIITEYTMMLGLDPEPVLRRVMLQLPGDHPSRPKTQEVAPSYDNMRANADAIMNRVPPSQIPIENAMLRLPAEPAAPPDMPQYRGGGSFDQRRHMAPPPPEPVVPFNELRAVPREHGGARGKSAPPPVAKKRKSSVFVPLIQLLLLMIILATGYMMWLGVNDPQAFEELKSSLLVLFDKAVAQGEVWIKFLSDWLQQRLAN